MRFKLILSLVFVAGLSVFARTSAAQQPAQDPSARPLPAQSTQDQQQSNPAVPSQRPMGRVMVGGQGMMTPDMMQMIGPMLGRGQGPGGPLQRVSQLLAALDDPRVRTVLGLTDQQADSLRKIIVDTETFTIKTALLRADKPDRAAVMSKGDQISKATAQLINHFLDAMLAAKAILTPEQQKMIRAYMERGGPALSTPPARR